MSLGPITNASGQECFEKTGRGLQNRMCDGRRQAMSLGPITNASAPVYVPCHGASLRSARPAFSPLPCQPAEGCSVLFRRSNNASPGGSRRVGAAAALECRLGATPVSNTLHGAEEVHTQAGVPVSCAVVMSIRVTSVGVQHRHGRLHAALLYCLLGP